MGRRWSGWRKLWINSTERERMTVLRPRRLWADIMTEGGTHGLLSTGLFLCRSFQSHNNQSNCDRHDQRANTDSHHDEKIGCGRHRSAHADQKPRKPSHLPYARGIVERGR